MVINSTNVNKTNNHLLLFFIINCRSPLIIFLQQQFIEYSRIRTFKKAMDRGNTNAQHIE